MNPPYGKGSSLSRKIVNIIHESKIADEIVCLAPPKTYIDLYANVDSWKGYYGWENTRMFEGAALENLCIVSINKNPVNKFESYLDCILDDKMKQLRNAVLKYNETHESLKSSGSARIRQYKKGSINESLIFLVPIFTPSKLNGVAFAGESYEHNFQKKPIDWNAKGLGSSFYIFNNTSEYDNFSKWWYGSGKRKEKSLLNFGFDILYRAYGGDPSLNKYREILPNLDWSHPWTDKEILKEIKLPEDFLEDQ